MSIHIDADFPGGNIIVEDVQSTSDGTWQVRLRQDYSTSFEWWFFWRFRVRGAAGQRVRFEFTDGDVFTALGPCYSVDGKNWQWSGRETVEGTAFSFEFAPQHDDVHFCLTIPYLEADLNRFLSTRSSLQRDVLTLSERGREVEVLRLPSRMAKYFVLLMARTHACESMANFVLEGMMDFWLSDEPQSTLLRDCVDLHVIPFMDKDGVEAGEQGKNRAPHDHNRDFTAQPLYASTRALMQQVPTWRGQLAAHIDVHCPWIRGGINEKLATVGIPYPMQAQADRYRELVQQTQCGPLRFNGDSTPHGTDWNQGEGRYTSSRYFYERFPQALVTTWETPYALASGQTMSADNARAFGRDAARALALYIEENE
jgi:hypothetical protein